MLIKIYSCNILISIISNAIIIEDINWKMSALLIVVLLCFALYLYHISNLLGKSLRNNKKSVFEPKLKYDDLFQSNQRIANKICKILENEESINCSICISGKWGAGKTSIINGVENKLGNKVEIIRINLLDFETIEDVIQYFFSELRRLLKTNDAYVGIGSEIFAYANSYLHHKSGVDFTNSLRKIFGSTDKEYRDAKADLDDVLLAAFTERRIVVAIDDIERCSANKIFSYIFCAKDECVIIGLNREKPLFIRDNPQRDTL